MSKLYDKVLVTTDGSNYSLNSFKHALSIADNNDSELIALTVLEDNFNFEIANANVIKEIKTTLNSKGDENLKELKEVVDELGSDVKITLVKKHGSPAKVILNVIEEEDIDLVVIGSSGKSGFDKFIMGSVANKVVNSAKCSVLVIKE